MRARRRVRVLNKDEWVSAVAGVQCRESVHSVRPVALVAALRLEDGERVLCW